MNYLDSLTLYNLKKYYGKHFYSMFGSLYLFGSSVIDSNKRRYVASNIGTSSLDNIPFLNTSDGNVTWTPGPLTIVSSSTNDTPSGIGASSIILEGINDNFTRVKEIVNLDGNNEVQSKKRFRFLNKAYVYRSGNNKTINNFNAGTIDISTGTTTASNSLNVPWATIVRGEGYASMAGYALQKGEMVLVTKVKIKCSEDVSGKFTMWVTDRDAISGLNMVEVPYAAATSVFNSRLGGEIIFDEPYMVFGGTIFFTVDNLTSKSLVSIEACGLRTDGEVAYEKQQPELGVGNSGYSPKPRDRKGKLLPQNRIAGRKAEERIENVVKRNTKAALRDESFFTMTHGRKKGRVR